MQQHSHIFYTDSFKLEINSQEKKCSLRVEVYCIYEENTFTESHFIKHTQNITNAEIFAISQIIEIIIMLKTQRKNFWIFTDSQSAIQNLQKDKTETAVHRNMR